MSNCRSWTPIKTFARYTYMFGILLISQLFDLWASKQWMGILALPQPVLIKVFDWLCNQISIYYNIFMFVHQPGEHLTLLFKRFSAQFPTLFLFLHFSEEFVFINLIIKLCFVKLLDGHFNSKFWPTGFWPAVWSLHSGKKQYYDILTLSYSSEGSPALAVFRPHYL